MRMTKLVTAVCTAVVFTLGVFALASQTQAGSPWRSEAADLNWVGECATSLTTTAVPAALATGRMTWPLSDMPLPGA